MRLERGAGARLTALVSAAVLLAGGAAPTMAQAVRRPTPEQQKTLEQVSLARARSELCDRVGALPIRQGVTISDWLTRDVGLDRGLRRWVRTRPRQGNVRLYSDAVCEADVRVEPSELCGQLLVLLDEYPGTAAPLGIDKHKLEATARRWPVLWATGRTTLSERLQSGQPPGWEDVTREGVVLARGAATADAYDALLAAAGGLKVTNARRLREFLESSDSVRDAVQAELHRVAKPKVEFAPDQVAVVEVRLSMRDLLRILTRVHHEHYRGTGFEAADFRAMAVLAGRDDLTAAGLAPPPRPALQRVRYRPIELNVPDWATTSLTAVGQYEPADGESPDQVTKREAARLDGIDRLYRQIEQLVIQKDVTVAEFLGYHQDLKDDVALFLSGARPVAQPVTRPDGGVEVKVELPLRRLWEIMRRNMKLEEVAPPDAPVNTEKETP